MRRTRNTNIDKIGCRISESNSHCMTDSRVWPTTPAGKYTSSASIPASYRLCYAKSVAFQPVSLVKPMPLSRKPRSLTTRTLSLSSQFLRSLDDAFRFLGQLPGNFSQFFSFAAKRSEIGFFIFVFHILLQEFAGSTNGGAIFTVISTSNKVAVLRMLPEMVMSASETRGCCSASESRRSLTLWSC